MRPRIYITQPVAQSALERLRAVADVELNPDSIHIVTKDELLDAVRRHDILFCLLHDHIDRDVIAANPDNVAQFKAGKDKAFNALVGQVMKASKGKANPAQVNELLRRKLG